MRLRNVKNKEQIINNCKFLFTNPNDLKGKWNLEFGNNNPIYIEIGSGKGKFIIENAKRYIDINFIAIEKYDSVIVQAIKNVPEDGIKNLRFIRMDAGEIDLVFANEVDRLYLNFSDPWPKERHTKRRLTSDVFLKKYDGIFKNVPEIHQKTDNRKLFEYSISSLSCYGYDIKEISLDLHNDECDDNIMTEYECKFVKHNKSIYRLIAKK